MNDVIAQALPVSFTLGMLSFGVALGVGVPLGFWAAAKRGKWQDYAATLAALTLVCVPAFVLGPILALVFGIHLRWLPVALWGSPWHVVLPVATLGLYFAGRVARLMREGMLDTMKAEFILTARAKGLTETQVLLRHAFRIAILPVVSYSGPLLADLLTGAFVVETIFQVPGLGMFLINGSLNRDYTLVVGLVMLYAMLLVVLNLLVDAAYSALDPRIRYG
ncbi:ABC transporter permease [bacterium]|nr:ABC transporter permease [bacterium]